MGTYSHVEHRADFSFFGGRLGGTIEYYDKRTSDLIYTYEVSTNRYPFGTMPANVGDISNKGIEFTINATPIQTKISLGKPV